MASSGRETTGPPAAAPCSLGPGVRAAHGGSGPRHGGGRHRSGVAPRERHRARRRGPGDARRRPAARRRAGRRVRAAGPVGRDPGALRAPRRQPRGGRAPGRRPGEGGRARAAVARRGERGVDDDARHPGARLARALLRPLPAPAPARGDGHARRPARHRRARPARGWDHPVHAAAHPGVH